VGYIVITTLERLEQGPGLYGHISFL